jgi:hypothetical protein
MPKQQKFVPGTATIIGIGLIFLAGLLSVLLGAALIIGRKGTSFHTAGNKTGTESNFPVAVDGISMAAFGFGLVVAIAFIYLYFRKAAKN